MSMRLQSFETSFSRARKELYVLFYTQPLPDFASKIMLCYSRYTRQPLTERLIVTRRCDSARLHIARRIIYAVMKLRDDGTAQRTYQVRSYAVRQ